MKVISYTLFDDFELKGIWWLPDNPDHQVSGELSYRATGEIVLDLMGSFSEIEFPGPKDLFQPEVIHGVTVTGFVCTLFKSYESNRQLNAPGIYKSTFTSRLLLIGKHYKSLQDILFSAIYVSYSNLEEWIRQTPFDMRPGSRIPGEPVLSCTYRYPTEFLAQVPSIASAIESTSSYSTLGDSFREQTIKHVSYLKVTPDERQSYQWFEQILADLTNFLTFLMGESAYVLRMIGVGDDVEIRPGKSQKERIHIFFARRRPPAAKKIQFFDMVLSLPALMPDIQHVLGRVKK